MESINDEARKSPSVVHDLVAGRKQMLTRVNEAQDKQAIRMRNLAQYTVIGPYELDKGHLVTTGLCPHWAAQSAPTLKREPSVT